MTTSDECTLLRFTIGQVTFLVPVERVREVVQLDRITPVPKLPPAVRGLMNVRGNVLPVTDLAIRFGRGTVAATAQACVVVVEVMIGEMKTPVGILTESIADVISIRRDEIEPPPSFGTEVNVAYLDGLVRIESGYALLMNVDKVFDPSDLLQIARSVEHAPQVSA